MPKLTRRNFLKVGVAAGAVVAGGARVSRGMELDLGGKDFHQIRSFHERKKSPGICTLCPYQCASLTFSEEGIIKKVEGNPDYIATRGKLCPKGLASFLGIYDPERISFPLKRVGKRGDGRWKSISWDEAIAEVAQRITGVLESGRTEEICLNEGSFSESPLVRFMNTLGSKSISRSRFPSLSNNIKRKALEYTFGADFLIPDLENTRYCLNFGSNLLETAFPLAQRLTDGIVEKRLKLVTFDVRMSNTAGRSDEWIPIFPGSDGIIALAMAKVIVEEGLADRRFMDSWTNYSFDEFAKYIRQFTPEMAEEKSGVPKETIRRIAIEFATARPAAVFTHNGVSYHQNGLYNEMACLLLPVITGNIEIEGGCMLPRRFDIVSPEPSPSRQKGFQGELNHTFPFKVKGGEIKVKALFNHRSNPAYSSPAASVWKEVLKDEKLIPYIVDFSPFMSETSFLSDIILPDVVDAERFNLVSSPSSLLPVAAISLPGIDPVGGLDVRMTLKKIIDALDEDGSRKMKQFWAFADPEEWTNKEVEGTKELKGHFDDLELEWRFPAYGKLDPKTKKILDNEGRPVKAEYGIHKKAGFSTSSKKIEVFVKDLQKKGLSPLPVWIENPEHKGLKENEYILTTFKVASHSMSNTTNLKYLTEMFHSNPLWINEEMAQKIGIKDGSLVRVSSKVGYLVTKAWLTQGIHPKVVGISTSVGRSAYGRVATAAPDDDPPSWSGRRDLDIDNNLWWRDKGVNVNDIIPISIELVTGSHAWFDTVVTVSPAEPGDGYGDIKVDNAKHLAVYEELRKKG